MKGYSLRIGINKYSEKLYQKNIDLKACVSDAIAMNNLASKAGFITSTLFDEFATKENVVNKISELADVAKKGDLVLISNSSHGSQIRDKNNDEPDGLDELLCLHDNLLIDDELYFMWSKFNSGVRILFISDSCHSGSVTRATENITVPEKEVRSNLIEKNISIKASGILLAASQDSQYAPRK
jgi:metacaspase-1